MTPVADQEAHKQFAQALRLMEESRTQERYSALESMVKAEKLLRLALHSVGLYQQTDIILRNGRTSLTCSLRCLSRTSKH